MAETQLTQKQQVQALGRKLVEGYNNPALKTQMVCCNCYKNK